MAIFPLVLALGLMGTSLCHAKSAEADEERTVPVGAIDTLELDFTPNFFQKATNSSIAAIHPGASPRELRVIPLKKGITNVMIFDEQGKLRRTLQYKVITNDLYQKILTIRHLLRDVEGITVKASGDGMVVDGALLDPRDLDRILKVQAAYRDSLLVLVSINPVVAENRARLMQKMITSDPRGKHVSVKVENGTFMLFGSVELSTDRARAEEIAQTYLPESLGSAALHQGVLTLGAKKFSIRNKIVVKRIRPDEEKAKASPEDYEYMP